MALMSRGLRSGWLPWTWARTAARFSCTARRFLMIGALFERQLDFLECLVAQVVDVTPARQPQVLIGIILVGPLSQESQGFEGVVTELEHPPGRVSGHAGGVVNPILIADLVNV